MIAPDGAFSRGGAGGISHAASIKILLFLSPNERMTPGAAVDQDRLLRGFSDFFWRKRSALPDQPTCSNSITASISICWATG